MSDRDHYISDDQTGQDKPRPQYFLPQLPTMLPSVSQNYSATASDLPPSPQTSYKLAPMVNWTPSETQVGASADGRVDTVGTLSSKNQALASEATGGGPQHDSHYKDLTYPMTRAAQKVWKEEALQIINQRNYMQFSTANDRRAGQNTPMHRLNQALDLTTNISPGMVTDESSLQSTDAKMAVHLFEPMKSWTDYRSGG